MIVFWTGWGILALFLPFLCFVAVMAGACLLNRPIGSWDEEPVLIGSAWMLTALSCWVVGRILNGRKPRMVQDPETGQEVAVRTSHTFMFLEMQWAGVLYGAIGVWHLVKGLLA